jgi:hypothetical protein
MGIEVGGIRITDTGQARALMAQGFISAEELNNVLPKLDSGTLDFEALADMQRRNLHRPFLQIIGEKLGLTKRK